jgi:YbbR domain-containing protein
VSRPTLLDHLMRAVTVNSGTKVISIAIAFVLWVIVLGSRNVEVTKEIPLEVITPPDIVAANDIPDKLSFRLSGPKAFLRAVLDRREEPIRVNLSSAKPGLVTYRFFSDNIRLPIGVKVLSINPAQILIKLEPQKRRDLPVRAEIRGFPPEGFRITKTEVKPKNVRIKGAESKVDSMTEVVTMPIDVTELRQTLDREVPLDLEKGGVQLDGPLPRVTLEVAASSANFRIKNVEVRVQTPHKFRVAEKTVTVLVRVDPNDLKLLDRTRVFATVNLQGKSKGKYTERVSVTLPENVGLVKVLPERVNVTLY